MIQCTLQAHLYKIFFICQSTSQLLFSEDAMYKKAAIVQKKKEK
jgi:hypothetical protein